MIFIVKILIHEPLFLFYKFYPVCLLLSLRPFSLSRASERIHLHSVAISPAFEIERISALGCAFEAPSRERGPINQRVTKARGAVASWGDVTPSGSRPKADTETRGLRRPGALNCFAESWYSVQTRDPKTVPYPRIHIRNDCTNAFARNKIRPLIVLL